MIPIKLTVEGLYSYQARQEIDFTKLTEAHIFGIFGSVGSGKSSILEAITFALYGKTERLNLSGDNRNYNMMNLKSDALFIEFEFKVAEDSYLVTVKGRRNSKKFEDVKALDRQAYKRIDGSWVPVELSEIEEAVGLSYENFKRTIIIPQGKFKEFLELGNKDRTQMMKELFNLNKFELFYKVTGLEAKNNQEIQNIKGQLQQLGEINPEQLKEAENLLDEVNKHLAELSKVREGKIKSEKVLAELKDLVEKLKVAGERLIEMKTKSGDFEKLEGKIKSYEYCVINFKALLESLTSSINKVIGLKDVVEKDKEDFEKYKLEIAKLEKELAELKYEYDKREDLRAKADELGKIAEVVTLIKDNDTISERVKKGEDIYKKTVDNVEQLKEKRIHTEKTLDYKKKSIPDVTELAKAKEWFTVYENLSKDYKQFKTKVSNLTLLLNKIVDGSYPLFSNELLQDVDLGNTTRLLFHEGELKQRDAVLKLTKLDVVIERNKIELESIEKETFECYAQKKLEDYAEGLKEGNACPLCGSKDHPKILSSGTINKRLKKLGDRKVLLNNEIEEATRLVDCLNDMMKEFFKTMEEYSDNKEELKIVEGRLEAHKKIFKWEKYQNVDDIERDFDEYARLQKSIKEYEDKLKRINDDIEVESKNLENYRVELDKIRSIQIENKGRIEARTSQIKLISLKDYENKSPEDIKDYANTYLKKYTQVEELYTKKSEELNSLHKKQAGLAGKMEANLNALITESALLEDINNSIAKTLQNSSYSDINDVISILNMEIDIETEKKELANYREHLQLLAQTYADLEKQIAGRDYSAEDHSVLLGEISDIEKNIEQKNQELGRTEGVIKKLKHELVQQKELLKRLAFLSLRAEDIKTMKQLFKGSGFVNYVSSVHLQNLCNAANDRFYKLTRQNLRLEMTDDNNFQVRDFMNGGKLRNVKTLSGGQTFQASLSLALALADSIQKFSNSSQNFFFLDEGFGSLDKEALSVVFDTLKSLRKENRIIGVISHVEEMQQEIAVYVRVNNNGDKGSMLEFSWN